MANLKYEIGSNDASVASVDMKLEVVVIPVSDVERAAERDFRIVAGRRSTTNQRRVTT